MGFPLLGLSVIKVLHSADSRVVASRQSRGAGAVVRWLVVGATSPAVLQNTSRFWCHCETTGYFAAPVCFDTPRDISYMHIYVHYTVAGTRDDWVESVLLLGRWCSLCSGFGAQK